MSTLLLPAAPIASASADLTNVPHPRQGWVATRAQDYISFLDWRGGSRPVFRLQIMRDLLISALPDHVTLNLGADDLPQPFFAAPLGASRTHAELAALFSRRHLIEPDPEDMVPFPDDIDF